MLVFLQDIVDSRQHLCKNPTFQNGVRALTNQKPDRDHVTQNGPIGGQVVPCLNQWEGRNFRKNLDRAGRARPDCLDYKRSATRVQTSKKKTSIFNLK